MNLSELFMKIAKEMKNDHFFGIPGSGVPLDLMDSGKILTFTSLMLLTNQPLLLLLVLMD